MSEAESQAEIDFRRIVLRATERLEERDRWHVTPPVVDLLTQWAERQRGAITEDVRAGRITVDDLANVAYQQLREAVTLSEEAATRIRRGVAPQDALGAYDPALVRVFGAAAIDEMQSAKVGAFAAIASMRRRCYYPPLRPIECP